MNRRNLPVVALTLLVLLGLLGSYSPAGAETEVGAKSLMLFIGDGMGVGILTIGMVFSEWELDTKLNMVMLANQGATGLVSTYSADKLVTDSAASGTALACGKKTDNGKVGVLPDETPVDNIFDIAIRQGKSLGVVTSTSVTHATPASFLAHHKYRSYEWDIAQQVAASEATVILGGGSKYFLPPERGGGRRDGDLTIVAEENGFEVVYDRETLLASGADRLLGLFTPENMPFERERDPETVPSLAEMTAKAIEILSKNEKGFLLMVEGGRIDHAAHDNDIDDTLLDLLAFDGAVGVAMGYQGENPDAALIVTADHETGGPAITAGGGDYEGYPDIDQYHTFDDETSPVVRWVSTHHTATMVPIFADGPGRERFAGIMDNTDVFYSMMDILGFEY